MPQFVLVTWVFQCGINSAKHVLQMRKIKKIFYVEI